MVNRGDQIADFNSEIDRRQKEIRRDIENLAEELRQELIEMAINAFIVARDKEASNRKIGDFCEYLLVYQYDQSDDNGEIKLTYGISLVEEGSRAKPGGEEMLLRIAAPADLAEAVNYISDKQ